MKLKIAHTVSAWIIFQSLFILPANAQISLIPEDIGWQEFSYGWRSFQNFTPRSGHRLSEREAFALDSKMHYVRASYRFHPLASAGGGLAWNGQHGSLNVFGRLYFYANDIPFFGLRPYTESQLDLMIGPYDDVNIFSQVVGLELQATLFKFQAGIGPGFVFGAHPDAWPFMFNSYIMLGVGFKGYVLTLNLLSGLELRL